MCGGDVCSLMHCYYGVKVCTHAYASLLYYTQLCSHACSCGGCIIECIYIYTETKIIMAWLARPGFRNLHDHMCRLWYCDVTSSPFCILMYWCMHALTQHVHLKKAVMVGPDKPAIPGQQLSRAC